MQFADTWNRSKECDAASQQSASGVTIERKKGRTQSKGCQGTPGSFFVQHSHSWQREHKLRRLRHHCDSDTDREKEHGAPDPTSTHLHRYPAVTQVKRQGQKDLSQRCLQAPPTRARAATSIGWIDGVGRSASLPSALSGRNTGPDLSVIRVRRATCHKPCRSKMQRLHKQDCNQYLKSSYSWPYIPSKCPTYPNTPQYPSYPKLTGSPAPRFMGCLGGPQQAPSKD